MIVFWSWVSKINERIGKSFWSWTPNNIETLLAQAFIVGGITFVMWNSSIMYPIMCIGFFVGYFPLKFLVLLKRKNNEQ